MRPVWQAVDRAILAVEKLAKPLVIPEQIDGMDAAGPKGKKKLLEILETGA